ncbi:MAG TPA: GNAT family N-acetyltransferase [Terracidiphilus sp.]|nr:GNAT family N-acetyltransferase [Terracidiphilus sp.]
MQIRDAAESDMDAIREIYNHVLTHSTAIYNDRPATREDRFAWWKARVAQGYPVLVAVDGGEVAGFASFGDFRAWPGYRFTVEGTVHIRSDRRGQGIGTALLHAIVDQARALGKHVIIAGVDAENAASLRYLEKFGFERAAYLREVGFKFGRYLDLVFLQYWLSPPERAAARQ